MTDIQTTATNSLLNNVLIVPGFHGSDDAHWQSWLQGSVAQAQRLSGVDWESPILSVWAGRIRQQLQNSAAPQWIVAHSFGCLAASVAVSDIPWQVAGLIFVAPADPARFSLLGCRSVEAGGEESAVTISTHSAHQTGTHTNSLRYPKDDVDVWSVLPRQPLGANGILIASTNDPWLSLPCAQQMAAEWQLDLLNVGQAGHINTASGFGPWPLLLDLLHKLTRDGRARQSSAGAAGKLLMRRGRGSVLANVRLQTRRQMERRI